MIATSGMDSVTARIATIQSRIDAMHPARMQRVPTYAAATATSTSAPSAAGGSSLTLATTGSPVALPGASRAGMAPVGGSTSTPQTVAALAARLPAQGQPWAGSIDRAAREAGIEPTLLASLVRHESNFDQGVVSHAGAIGLAQLMPGTADWLGVNPHDADENLAGGARYLREQLDRFGTVELALAAYNAGPNAVTRAGGVPRFAETQAYVPRVMATWQELR